MAENKQDKQLLSVEQKNKIVALLQERKVPQECPMCRRSDWSIGDGFVIQHLHNDYRGMRLDGTSIPSIPIICNKCGFMSYHALGVLGLLEEKSAEEEGKF
jgi:predicted Zn-ribbon and HTH transcriptional regulator